MLENPWFINIACGILLPTAWYIINYFTDSEIWKRKRLKYCRSAIKRLMDRFGIYRLEGNNDGPILSYKNYILILYEIQCLINGCDTTKLKEKEIRECAESWHDSFIKQNMKEAIEVYTVYEMSKIMEEVNSYGTNGKGFIAKNLPTFRRAYYASKNRIRALLKYDYKKIILEINNKLYSRYKLPKPSVDLEAKFIMIKDSQ